MRNFVSEFISKKPVILIALLLSAIFYAGHAYAGCSSYATNGSVTDGYYLDNSCTAIINNYAPCKVVTNSTGARLFIPSYYPGGTNTIGQDEWNSFLAHPPAGVSVASCSCTLPWGGSLAPGQSATAYQNNPVACHGSCVSQTRTCTCTDSSSLCVLSGSYTKQSCSVTACLPCSLPWGGSIADGQSAGAYAASSVACGSSCSGQTRSCNNGSLSGSYTKQGCSVQPCPCSLPWGGSLASGSHVTAYRYASVAYGGSCTSQNRICSNGTLSGSYTNKTCTVQAPASCSLPWGGSLAHGASVTAYAASSVACGSSCSSQSRKCTNGSLSGSYTKKTCSVQSCPTNCAGSSVSWGSGCHASTPALASGASTTVSYDVCSPSGNGGTWGSTTVKCSAGSLVLSGSTCNNQGTCFIAGTYVLMADGSSKFIEDLKVGDKVRGHTRINTVTGLPNYDNPTPIYGFNGGKPFVTGGHPFWTAEGWKAIDPSLTPKERHNVKTTQLKVGDVLLLENGQPFTVRSINMGHKAGPHHVYDPQVDGDHTYYANGLLVHNKRMCSGGPLGCECAANCYPSGGGCQCPGKPYLEACY